MITDILTIRPRRIIHYKRGDEQLVARHLSKMALRGELPISQGWRFVRLLRNRVKLIAALSCLKGE